jgi:HSP20 family protein
MNSEIDRHRTIEFDMNFLIKSSFPGPLFGRSIDNIISEGFFTSFDTNIHDLTDKYVLQVAVPGMKKEHLSIELSDNVLRVYGEKKRSKHNTLSDYNEFSSVRYSRSFILPQDIDENGISAECSDGLLHITIGKKRTQKSVTHIEIKQSKPEKESFFSRIMKPFRKK